MRIFVGTLYTIENEFEECVASIGRQSYRNFQHFVFENLPNKEAHDTLYRTFMQRADEFDLFIKVDADMVIDNEHLFAKIVRKFQTNDWLNGLEIAVHDFFSDQLIPGMDIHRNTVKWKQNEENLFTDMSPVPEHQQLHDVEELAPAAIHCKNPSPFQAFHYGIHRGLKVIQPDRTIKNRWSKKFQWNNIERTWQNFQKRKDIRLGLAVLGAELVFRGTFQVQHVDYSNPFTQEVFRKYESYNAREVEAKIRHLRNWNWGVLRGKWRREVLCYLKSEQHFSKSVVVTLLRELIRKSD